jgi:hypothetical protein
MFEPASTVSHPSLRKNGARIGSELPVTSTVHAASSAAVFAVTLNLAKIRTCA